MNLSKWITLTSTFWILFVGCRKVEDIYPPGLSMPCEDLPPSDSPFGYEFELPEISYSGTTFNPNNPNEIAVVKKNHASGAISLVVFNLVTKEEFLICDQILGASPKWSVKNWILIYRQGLQTWKVKSNGDSLTQLSFSGIYNFPIDWSPDGTKFVYFFDNIQRAVIADEYGNHLDTIHDFAPDSWSPDGGSFLGVDRGQNISRYEISSGVITPLAKLQSTGSTSDNMKETGWLKDGGRFIWSDGHGIYRSSLSLVENKMIVNACGTKYYHTFAISPDEEFVLADRIIREKVGDNTIRVESNIVKLDLSTGELLEVLL